MIPLEPLEKREFRSQKLEGRRATIIAKLRRKLERSPAEPAYIITVHKVGYKFLG